MKNLTPSPGGTLPDHPAAKPCRPGTVPAGTVGAGTVRRDQCPRLAPDQHHHRPRAAPAPRHHYVGREAKPEQQRTHRAACPGFFLLPIFHALPLPRPCPAATPMMATACPWSACRLPRRGADRRRQQHTARPAAPAASAPAAPALPTCCPCPCQTYRQRPPTARQHPAASPTPKGSDSPPNGIEL